MYDFLRKRPFILKDIKLHMSWTACISENGPYWQGLRCSAGIRWPYATPSPAVVPSSSRLDCGWWHGISVLAKREIPISKFLNEFDRARGYDIHSLVFSDKTTLV